MPVNAAGWSRWLAGCDLVTIRLVPATLITLVHGLDVAGCSQTAPGLHKHPSDVLALPDPLPTQGLRCFFHLVPSTETAPVCDWHPSQGSPGQTGGCGSKGKTFISRPASGDGDMLINALDICWVCCWFFLRNSNPSPICQLECHGAHLQHSQTAAK